MSMCRIWACLLVALPLETVGCNSDRAPPRGATRGDAVANIDYSKLELAVLESELVSEAPAIRKPVLLRIADGVLWIADLATDPGLHALDPASGDLIVSLGPRGEGVGQFVRRPFNLLIAPDDSGGVWAFDMQLQRLTRFEPQPLSEASVTALQLQGEPRVWRVAWVDRQKIVGVSNSKNHRLSVFSSDGNRTMTRPGALLGDETVPETERLRATNGGIKVCAWPHRGFVIANIMVGRIEYYDLDARFLRLAEVPFESEPTFTADSSGVARFNAPHRWYVDCATTNEHLYALFSGRLRAAYDGDEGVSGEFVHVFGWEGDLKGVFRLDRALRSIEVTPSGDVLFAGSLVDGRIYRYRLPPPSALDGSTAR